MAIDFPCIRDPIRRILTPGAYPVRQFVAMNGATTVIARGKYAADARLTLEYSYIEDTDVALIWQVWYDTLGGGLEVSLPYNAYAGIDSSLVAQVPAYLRWYMEEPQIGSVQPGLSAATLVFVGRLAPGNLMEVPGAPEFSCTAPLMLGAPCSELPDMWMLRLTNENTSMTSSNAISGQVLLSPDGFLYHAATIVMTSTTGRTMLVSKHVAATGATVWQKRLGTQNDNTQISNADVCLAFHPSGDIILASSSSDAAINFVYAVSRISPDGNLIWQVRPKATNNFTDYNVHELTVAPDGSIYVSGSRTNTKAWVARHNPVNGLLISTVQFESVATTVRWAHAVSDGLLVGGPGPAGSGGFLAKLSLDLSSIAFFREYAGGGFARAWGRAADGSLFAAYESSGNRGIVKLSADGSSVLAQSGYSGTEPADVIFDGGGNCYISLAPAAGTIDAVFASRVTQILKYTSNLSFVERREVRLFDGSSDSTAYRIRAVGVSAPNNHYISTHTQVNATTGRWSFIYGVNLKDGPYSMDNNISSTASSKAVSAPTPFTPPALTVTSPTVALATPAFGTYGIPLTWTDTSYTWDYVSTG
jgi:WD40 repeat protein